MDFFKLGLLSSEMTVEKYGAAKQISLIFAGQQIKTLLYHRERILKTSTLSCNEEEEEITKPPTR
jgi:hypothetical protein